MAQRDAKTEWLRVQTYRKMKPQERIQLAADMFDDGVSIVRSSILDRHPDISAEELKREIRRRVLLHDLRDRDRDVGGSRHDSAT